MDSKAVKHMAQLARIRLTEKEEGKIQDELSAVLGYIEQLNEVETEGVSPLYQTTGLTNSTRSDEHFKDPGTNDKLLTGQAPHLQDRFVKVKSVLRKS